MAKPLLNYCLVTQNLASIIEDSTYDSDRFPDVSDITGEVIFTPNVANGKAYQLFDREDNTYTVPVSRVRAKIINGEITHEDVTGVYLFAAGPGSNPDRITYSVEYRNLRSGELSFSLSPLKFEAIPGGEVDLTIATPVIGAAPAGTTKGDKGDKGDPFLYEDFTQEQIDDLKGPLTLADLTPERLETIKGPQGDRGAGIHSVSVDGSDLVFTVDEDGIVEVSRVPLVEAANGIRDELSEDLTASKNAVAEAEGYANQSASSASESASSASAAATYKDISSSAADRAEFAANETIQQVEGDFATRNYTDDAVNTLSSSLKSQIDSRVTQGQATSIAYGAAAALSGDKSGVTIGQATSIAYGAAAALSGGSSTPPPVVVEGLPVWDASYPVYLWGDSAIDRGVPGDRLEDYLNSAIHQTVVDNSNGGTPIGDVLIRTGATPLYGIPVGGVIPAGVEPVKVDLMGADTSMTHGGEIPVTWSDVPGKITYYAARYHESGYHTIEFIRSEPGEEVPIATPTRLEPVDVFDPYATHIVVSGGNDASKGYITTAPEGDKAGHLIGSYIKLVEQAAAAPVKHILIAGVKTRAETMPGDNNHNLVTQVNNQLKQLFPHIFVDRQRWLCERGPEILGLELTPDEQIQRDAGIVPARVFSDSTHVGSEIRQAEAKELWAFALAQRGWAQLKNPVNGHHMPIMANTITTTDLV